jgi:hypothetical protein
MGLDSHTHRRHGGSLVDQRLATIKAKAAEQGHGFGPPLSPAEVTAFERRHGIELPAAYRQFLVEVGNGGDGPPAYGLMRLGETPRHLCPAFQRSWGELADVAKPFPFTTAWVWEGEPDDPGKRATARFGSLNLGDNGCGWYWLLIVTGSERGKVWAYTDVGVCPQEPDRDFLQWVEAWLDGVSWWAEPNTAAGRPREAR